MVHVAVIVFVPYHRDGALHTRRVFRRRILRQSKDTVTRRSVGQIGLHRKATAMDE